MLERGMFKKQGQTPAQEQFWVEAKALPPATPSRFYQRVEETLRQMEFAREVWAICAPAYAATARGGRPGVDPVVYLKMLMVGFFENLLKRTRHRFALCRFVFHPRLPGL